MKFEKIRCGTLLPFVSYEVWTNSLWHTFHMDLVVYATTIPTGYTTVSNVSMQKISSFTDFDKNFEVRAKTMSS